MPVFSRAVATIAAAVLLLGLATVPAASAAPAAPAWEPDIAHREPVIGGAPHTGETTKRQSVAPAPSQARAAVAAPVNDNYSAATSITSLPFSVQSAAYNGSTLEAEEPTACRTTDPDHTEYFTPTTGSVWYKYTSPIRQTLTFSGGVDDVYSVVNAYEAAPVADLSRISCVESGYRDTNFVQAVAGRTYYFQVGADPISDIPATSGAQLRITASAPVANTTFGSASTIAALPATITGSNTKVDFNWYAPYTDCPGFQTQMGNVWYKFTSTSATGVLVDLRNSWFNADFTVWESDGTTPTTLVTCPPQITDPAYDEYYDKTVAYASFIAAANKTYFIQVGSYAWERGDFVLELSKVGTLTGGTPTITGIPTAGNTLTANPGTWGPQPVTLSYDWLQNGYSTGDHTPTYTVGPNEKGSQISVRVTGTKSGYADLAKTSAPTTIVDTLGLTPTPTITGTPAVGSTLTANPGSWDSGVALSYQWKRGGAAISGATGKSYVLGTADAGAAVTVSVTGSKSGYLPATKTSAPTAAISGGSSLTGATPTISGSAVVGRILTAAPGTWGPAPVSLAYQWNRAGVAISGANASTYTLTAADFGNRMTVTVTGSKPGYAPLAKTSTSSFVVAAGPLGSVVPTITGTAAVGQKLTANPGTWTPAPVSYGYAWYRDGTAISGATASTYTPVAADSGKAITVRVTGTKTGYLTTTKSSTAKTIAAGSLTGPTPTISGTATVGQTLTAKPGSWAPAPVTLSYQWYRGSTAISGAKAATYKLVAADRSASITVRVTGVKAGYTTLTKTSAVVKPK